MAYIQYLVSEPYSYAHITEIMETKKNKESSFGLNYPTLTKTNYTAWAMKMKVYMQAHGVWEAIESKDPKAVVEDKMDK